MTRSSKINSLDQVYEILSYVCVLLDKNNIPYLVYGSVAVNLIYGKNKLVNDIDIIVSELDFPQIRKLLSDLFNPVQTEFSIHANSKKYLGNDDKPFDVSFDSLEHYFQDYHMDFTHHEEKKVNGVLVKTLPKDILEKIYKDKSSKDGF